MSNLTPLKQWEVELLGPEAVAEYTEKLVKEANATQVALGWTLTEARGALQDARIALCEHPLLEGKSGYYSCLDCKWVFEIVNRTIDKAYVVKKLERMLSAMEHDLQDSKGV